MRPDATSPVGQFADQRARLEQLLQEAALLERRARQLATDERRVAELRRSLDHEAESLSARATELQEREREVGRREAELLRASVELQHEEARLEAESDRIACTSDELAVREERFLRRWRWLIGCLGFLRSRRGSSMLPCDVLFVPTQDGYRLLEQSGLAVAPGAVLHGLIGDDRRFEVTKIAALPLEERVCAYLQETSTREGDGS